jgi:transcriptional regulator with XRE-family HTH domain
LSLDALAKLVHCSSSHLSEVENARKLPSVGLIQNLDRVLGTASEGGLVERFWGAVAEQTVERHDRQARRRQADERRAALPSASVQLQPTGVPDAGTASGASPPSARLQVAEPGARGREVKRANRRTAIKPSLSWGELALSAAGTSSSMPPMPPWPPTGSEPTSTP